MEELANQKILIPELGGADAVEVIEISVAVGDQIDKDQSIIVVESDKVYGYASPKEVVLYQLLKEMKLKRAMLF